MKRSTKIGVFGFGIVIGLALALVGWRFLSAPASYHGSTIDPPIPAADFELQDQWGQPFRLSDQRGKVVLIFFGYTHCPDVCPVTLSQMKQIKEGLGPKAEGVRFVFVTVDPERDTPESLQKHLANFDPAIVGLSGTRAELEPVWKSYGVYQEKVDSGSAAGYLVDHTARTYAVDANGNWRLTFPFGMETSQMLEDTRHLLQEN